MSQNVQIIFIKDNPEHKKNAIQSHSRNHKWKQIYRIS